MNTASSPVRIAVVRYRFIGDALLSLPFLAALRAQYPQAHITLFSSPDSKVLFENCEFIDAFETFEPKQNGFWASVKQLKSGHFNTLYLLKRSFSSALIAWLSGIRQRIGFATEARRWLLTQAIPYKGNTQHEAQCYLDLLPQKTELQHVQNAVQVPLPPAITDNIKINFLSQLPAHKQWVVIHPHSSNRAKCWPIEHYRQVMHLLLKTGAYHFIFLGSPQEASFLAPLLNDPTIAGHYTNWCGQTNLQQTLGLLRHMHLVIANDSGMTHLAASANCKQLAIFGPMPLQQWKPLASNSVAINYNLLNPQTPLSCQPCKLKITCNHTYPCLTDITPQQVFDMSTQLLSSPT